MSDPMTNIEIEDVLSSIRRLVADGGQDAAAPQSPEPARKIGKLVLTPAFRVDTPPADTVVLSDDVRVDIGTDGSASDDRHDVAKGAGAAEAPADRGDLLATIAELEAAVLGQSDDWEPDGTGTDTDLSWARAGFRGDVEVEEAEVLAAGETPSADAAEWPETLAEAARRFGDGDDDAEIPVAQFRHHRSENVARDDVDEDEDHDDDLIGGPDLGDDPEDMLERYLATDTVIDEVILREMVRDIVRQELQGKLGERITRNVRKLVRREIHRVLTTQNFD